MLKRTIHAVQNLAETWSKDPMFANLLSTATAAQQCFRTIMKSLSSAVCGRIKKIRSLESEAETMGSDLGEKVSVPIFFLRSPFGKKKFLSQ